jgi:hypothetical protein
VELVVLVAVVVVALKVIGQVALGLLIKVQTVGKVAQALTVVLVVAVAVLVQ